MQKEVIDNVDIFKVGTNVLVKTDAQGRESLRQDAFRQIGLETSGDTNAIIVTSAAITAGMIATKTTVRPNKETDMAELQALASIGWGHILNSWDDALFRKQSGGLLLTRQELSSRRPERQQALETIHALLSRHAVPVVNENDAITHEEIAFGDNDRLSATLAAQVAHSKLFGKNVRLFLLTNVSGVYENRDDPSTRIPVIEHIADYQHLAGGSDSPNGTGGMATKFMAAEIATAAGVDMWVYNPTDGHRNRAVRGEIGTYFPAQIKQP